MPHTLKVDAGARSRIGTDAMLPARHVDELFVRQARSAPDRIAIVDGATTWTYRQLHDRMRVASAWLGRQGLSDESAVAVWMDRSPRMVAMLLAVMAAGACCVPIDPQEPAQRVRRMLRIARARLVIGSAALLNSLRDGDPAASSDLDLPRMADAREIDAGDAPPGPMAGSPDGDRLAYLVFTSDSSGEPKAVEVEHGSVVNLLHAVRALIGFSAEDRCLAASAVGSDVSVAELFLPLSCGGSLLLSDRSILREPRRLAADIRAHGVTVFQTGPSVWSTLLEEVPEFPRLRVAITTGEAIAPALARRLASRADQVWNLYGQTETTVWAAAQRLDSAGAAARGLSTASAPIGRPLDGLWCRIAGPDGRTVADGEIGELWIGGLGVARGYRGLASATQARFVDALGSGRQRMYRTGDRVARSADGTLHYFGRVDDQIQVRGTRIEPAEVEAALLRDPRAARAAVTWVEGPRQARTQVAAVVLEALPLTPGGKVDRIAIRHVAAPAAADAVGVMRPLHLAFEKFSRWMAGLGKTLRRR